LTFYKHHTTIVGMIHEPKNLTLEQKQRIVKAARYKVEKGGVISCGHDFWEHAKDKPPGDTFLCTSCYQYFVKMNDLPWWIDGGKNMFGRTCEPHSSHLGEATRFPGAWYHPVDFRLQDVNGNSITKQ
jgi:hypothetical protein